MHPSIQYELAKSRMAEMAREAEQDRLARAARSQRQSVEWTGFVASFRKLVGRVRARPAEQAAEASA